MGLCYDKKIYSKTFEDYWRQILHILQYKLHVTWKSHTLLCMRVYCTCYSMLENTFDK